MEKLELSLKMINTPHNTQLSLSTQPRLKLYAVSQNLAKFKSIIL